MDPIALTRQLVDIESTTGNEGAVVEFLAKLPLRRGLDGRAHAGRAPGASTSLPTGLKIPRPPSSFPRTPTACRRSFASSEDATRIFGRGSCDAKGILAAQVAAVLRLHD